MASSVAFKDECCKLFNSKQMEYQIGENEICAICVKVPCKSGAAKCSDKVQICCVNPDELEKCCKENAANNEECCVCVLCDKNKLQKVFVQCCGTREELSADVGKAVCICVPKIDGGKCGGKVRMTQCDAHALDECCKANTEGRDCCCVCLSSNDQKCMVTVRCPESASVAECGTAAKCCN
uniref:Uncharacterized protein n=1 Tax=Globodera rostochiensis TaxID=31243 RepID=A0A914H4E6_GLORO